MKPALKKLINEEIERQKMTLDLIASENVADPEMLRILGSPLVNKYSEGYPGRRYYPGNEIYDEIENLAKASALKAFKLSLKNWGVNVQSYSGSPANQATYLALIKPGDIIMGLSLAHGGHLTHGHAVNFSGILYKSVSYFLDLKTGYIDYENLSKLARKYRPKIIISGASSYPRKIDFKKIGEIARQIGAYHLADISHIAGLIAAQVHPSPFPYADVVMTTTHKTLRGPRGAVIFADRKALIAKHNKVDLVSAIDKAVFPGLQGGPHNNVTAAMAWNFMEVQKPSFRKYSRQIVKNAKTLAHTLISHGFNLSSGGTDNHLLLIDLHNKNIDGVKAQELLERSGINANRNVIPGDKHPLTPSGVRLGTPAVTSRGMKEREMEEIGALIYRCLVLKKSVKKEVLRLCKKFPLPYLNL